jgi:hypothetical protein
MVPMLEAKRVPLKRTRVNPAKAVAVAGKVAAEVAADPHLRFLAERALVSYMRSLLLHPLREAAAPHEVDLEGLAKSFGLPAAPKVKSLARALREARISAESKSGGSDAPSTGLTEDEPAGARAPAAAWRVSDEKKAKNQSYALQNVLAIAKKERGHGAAKGEEQTKEESESEEDDDDEDVFRRARRSRPEAEAPIQSSSDLLRPEDLSDPRLPWYDRRKMRDITRGALELGRQLDAERQRAAVGGVGPLAALATERGGTVLGGGDPRGATPGVLPKRLDSYASRVKQRLQEADQRDKELARARSGELQRTL